MTACLFLQKKVFVVVRTRMKQEQGNAVPSGHHMNLFTRAPLSTYVCTYYQHWTGMRENCLSNCDGVTVVSDVGEGNLQNNFFVFCLFVFELFLMFSSELIFLFSITMVCSHLWLFNLLSKPYLILNSVSKRPLRVDGEKSAKVFVKCTVLAKKHKITVWLGILMPNIATCAFYLTRHALLK